MMPERFATAGVAVCKKNNGSVLSTVSFKSVGSAIPFY